MEPGYYGVVSIDGLIGTGVTTSSWCTLNGVVKRDTAVQYTVANEFICGSLGAAAGLPVPPGTVARLDDDTYAYVALKFGLRGDAVPPVDPDALVTGRPQLAAGIVVFDCWILNPDRHKDNLAFVPSRRSVSIFDHGHALLGAGGDGEQRLDSMRDTSQWSGCLLPHLKSARDLRYWVERIGSIHDDFVEDISQRAADLCVCSEQEAKKAAEVINYRKRRLGHYLEANRQQFPQVQDWELGGML